MPTPSALPVEALPHREDEARWDAVMARDARFDGQFVFSVETTGIYCRPSCPSRRAKREHIRFHADAAAAERAGFRACKRCCPDQPSLFQRNAERIEAACRTIEQAEAEPTLECLAREAKLSPYHFHRLFKAALGVTPKAYARAHRHKQMRDRLGESRSVTEAIYQAGFNSNGRFYADAPAALGMTPGTFRRGGETMDIKFSIGTCSLGPILVAATDKGVCAIFFGDSRESLEADLRKTFPSARSIVEDHALKRELDAVIAFVETPQAGLDLPLDVQGTAFQHRVWQALQRIPLGSTASYTEIAEKIGAPGSARAVARACATNPVSLAIPCHRVVRSDGSLSGYRGGVERKRALLSRELGTSPLGSKSKC